MRKFKLAENVLSRLLLFYPLGIQNVNEIVSSSEQIWRNVALHHSLITSGSSAVNGCRQNESKQLIKTLQ